MSVPGYERDYTGGFVDAKPLTLVDRPYCEIAARDRMSAHTGRKVSWLEWDAMPEKVRRHWEEMQ